jgi:hypothetical protein
VGSIAGEWKGETTAKAPRVDKPSIARNTASQDAKKTLERAQITPEVVDSLSQVVGKAVQKQLGLNKDETIKLSLDSMKSMIESDVRKWIADVSVKLANSSTPDTSGIEQRIHQIEEKLTIIQDLATTRQKEERELIELALKTVNDAKETDDETASKSSNVARLELRQKELEKQITFLEQQKLKIVKPSSRLEIGQASKGKKKFSSTVY